MKFASAIVGFFVAHKFAHLPSSRRVEIRAAKASEQFVWFNASNDIPSGYPISFIFNQMRSHVVLSGEHEIEGSLKKYSVSRWLNGSPDDNLAGFINGWLALLPQDLALTTRSVQLSTSKMSLPAEYQPGNDTWVILVHGRTARPAETFRALTIFTKIGVSALAISIRNDFVASTTARRVSHFGLLEANDFATAVQFAKANGAKTVLAYGISMGAVAISTYMRSNDDVDGVMLDSPLVDWVETIDFSLEREGVSRDAALYAMKLFKHAILSKLIGLKTPVDLAKLGFSNWHPNFNVPLLVMHSVDDGYVPYEPVAKLVRAHPENIQIETWCDAKHVQLFNSDRTRYEELLTNFVRRFSK